MAVNENTFNQYNEGRAVSGYKSAWLYKLPSEEKYHLIAATESVPYPFGDNDTFEFDLLQSATKGKVGGKMSLDSVDVAVLHHRDNAYRFNALAGVTLDFMSINAEYMGYKFNGTLSYRPNTAEADIHKATVTITPMSADTKPVYNARDLIMDTLCFANTVPATVKAGEPFSLAVIQNPETITIESKSIAKDGSETEETVGTVTGANTNVTVTNKSDVVINAPGLYVLTVKADGYASWTTTVYVESAT